MSKLIGIIATVVVAVVVLAAVMFFVMDDGEDDDSDQIMTFNGVEYTWDELEEQFGNKTVGENVGISLSEIMNSTAFGDLDSDTQNMTVFSIIADDWQKTVSWMDLQSGILMGKDMKTYFPDLPKAYNVENIVSIDDVPIGPIAIIKDGANWDECAEVTWEGLFDELNETDFVQNNQNYSGLGLIDVLEYAGFTDLANASYTIEGVDGYSRPVTYTDIQSGYLVEDQYKTVFVNLSGQYKVKNVFRIIVEY